MCCLLSGSVIKVLPGAGDKSQWWSACLFTWGPGFNLSPPQEKKIASHPLKHMNIELFLFCKWEIYLFVYFYLCSTRAWTQGLILARQTLYHLSHTPKPKNYLFNVSILTGWIFVLPCSLVNVIEECLPSRFEALSSNPSTTKRKMFMEY
jgi:hypothetical protein